MDEQETENEIKKLKQISAFCETMVTIPSDEKRSDEIKNFFENLKANGFLDEDYVETEENKYLKSQLVKAILIYDDLSLYDGIFVVIEGRLDSICRMYQATKNSFLPLALLKTYISGWGRYHKDDTELNELKEKIWPGLEFANHVRNKITGHLENDVIDNSVQWEPTIFHDSNKDDQLMQRLLMYKSILESAINSYIDDKTGAHKLFSQEIDMLFPDTSNLFYMYLQNLIRDSMLYLNLLIGTMRNKIEYFHGLPANLIKSAGETDFKTKNKGR